MNNISNYRKSSVKVTPTITFEELLNHIVFKLLIKQLIVSSFSVVICATFCRSSLESQQFRTSSIRHRQGNCSSDLTTHLQCKRRTFLREKRDPSVTADINKKSSLDCSSWTQVFSDQSNLVSVLVSMD